MSSADEDTELRIPMKLDGIFSYFPTRSLTQDEIENCEDMQTLNLTPDAAQWDPYDEDFAEAEDRFLDFRGDLLNRPAKRCEILDDVGVFELQVSEERYEAAISSIVAANHNCVTDDEGKDFCSNLQGGDLDFVRDDDYMQAGIADITACFDEELLRRAVTEREEKSKVAMEAGDIFLDGFEDKHDPIFTTSAAHAEPQWRVTAKLLS